MSDQNRCAYHYTVKSGDSYYAIAQRLNVNLNELLSLNSAIPPNKLTVGDVLCIPFTQSAPPSQGGNTGNNCEKPDSGSNNGTSNGGNVNGNTSTCPENRRTVVQPDQTAEELLLKYGLSFYTLQSANPTTDLGTLQGGDVLCIPEENIACPAPNTYTLKTAETLESAAMNLQVPVASLLRANPCLAPSDFSQGVTIRVPRTR